MLQLESLGSYLYTYRAHCVRVIDGDTLELEIDLGLHVRVREKCRLFGINTPETYGVKKDSEEYQKGKEATLRVMELLRPENQSPEPAPLWVNTHKDKTGKYGRYLVEVFLYGPQKDEINAEEETEHLICLNELLVDEGLAERAEY